MKYDSNQYLVGGEQRSEGEGQPFMFQVPGRQESFRFRIWNLEFRILSVVCFFLFGIFIHGCASPTSKPYHHSLVITYAELTLLYEKEKMNNKIVDSLYQVKVKDFFEKKGLEQNEFKKEIEELSENNAVWKMFIQDVTAAMDSLKSAEK